MVIAYIAKHSRPFLLLVVLAGSAGLLDGSVCRAQPHAVPIRSSVPRAGQSESLIADGVAAFERGDVPAARALFQKALALNPDDVGAHTYLGVVADASGDLKEAERHFARASRLAPTSAAARNNYGAILRRLGCTREAVKEFEAALKADARYPNALVNLAQIRFADGTPDDLRAASELFARAFAVAPDAAVARAQTVVALRRKDQVAAAAHYRDYTKLLGAEGGAPQAGDQAGGSVATARVELGTALLEAGLFGEAETELNAALSLDAANADAALQLARVHLARKEIAAAGRTLETAVARGFDSAAIYALLAEVYEQSGHPENAIPAMRLAIERDPKSEKYRFAYGLLLMNAYAPAAAVTRLKEALKLFPDSPRLWFALGLAHFKQEKDDEATQALKHALTLDSAFAPAYAYLGMIEAKAGAYGEGIRLYEQALKINPTLTVVDYLIADALLKQSETDAARVETHLKRVVSADATFIPARLALAKILMRSERWAEAAGELEKVKSLDPSMAEAYYQLGRVYVRLKRPAEAQTALATFKRLSETQRGREKDELREVVKRLGNVSY